MHQSLSTRRRFTSKATLLLTLLPDADGEALEPPPAELPAVAVGALPPMELAAPEVEPAVGVAVAEGKLLPGVKDPPDVKLPDPVIGAERVE
ncbi:MAG: hypothetical protein Q9160_009158 [Pyrenula sp. 1 TL-2023]